MKWYEYFAAFVMLYPGVMSVYWTLSGLLYFLFWERRKGEPRTYGQHTRTLFQ